MITVVLLGLTSVTVDCAAVDVDGAPVVDSVWLDAQVEQANTVFAPAGIRFVRAAVARTVPAGHADLLTRRDRTALADHLRREVINCFVVRALADIHEAGRRRQGVHWRPRGHRTARKGAHYVILAAYAGKTVLAHELGHFFGNRTHPETPGNIMSYDRGQQPPFFDAGQLRTIGRFLRAFLRSGELRPVQTPK